MKCSDILALYLVSIYSEINLRGVVEGSAFPVPSPASMPSRAAQEVPRLDGPIRVLTV